MTYECSNYMTYRVQSNGERVLLANFIGRIVRETRYIDGDIVDTVLTIAGYQRDPNSQDKVIQLPPTSVSSSEFGNMSWVMKAWGVRAVISPGSLVKDDLRTEMQLASTPEVVDIYKHTGWANVKGKPSFLHAGGAITRTGNDKNVKVWLPPELSKFNLATPNMNLQDSIKAVLSLASLAPPEIGWTILAATLTPLHGPVDFAIHLTGKTGTFKSELMSLFQSLYGSEMDARHLPGSWSSTPNALEAQAYHLQSVPFVVDDFVPSGSSWQVRAYQQTAEKLVRAQGNQAGRARLTDVSNLQTTMYPRGIVLSTGEDTPDGHSIRARMMILELAPGDITPTKLTTAQKLRSMFPFTTSKYIQSLCKEPSRVRYEASYIRDQNLEVGHSRTPAMLGRLAATIEHFLTWAGQQGVSEAPGMIGPAQDAILQAANSQQEWLEVADPVELFMQAIRSIFATGLGHARSTHGGIPQGADQLGWTQEGNDMGDIPIFKSHGPCIGWVNWDTAELFLDINAGYPLVRKVAGPDIALGRQTMIKRLKDAGVISRAEELRKRNTARIQADGRQRHVIAFIVFRVLENQEKPDEVKATEDGTKPQELETEEAAKTAEN